MRWDWESEEELGEGGSSCWLGWSRSQGFGCSPIKVVRELGLERCETVRSLSTIIKKNNLSYAVVREDSANLSSYESVTNQM